ncbi:hypothetical protein [Glaciihabitans sp. UYNi722]|uniref:hypothetical protein n=1 Tax=Glaciihabitans sp. UYNi722 TaxID=3156344 RepID=UPI00339948C6
MKALSREERRQLAHALGCTVGELDGRITSVSEAATREYLAMFLGQEGFSRVDDFLVWRLYLLIDTVFAQRLPSTATVSALFQTTASRSRSLLRSVMSKYQYQLQEAITESLQLLLDASESALDDTAARVVVPGSDILIEALNDRIASRGGDYPSIGKVHGHVNQYRVEKSSFDVLVEILAAERAHD